jgi:hypothetical protein
VSGGKNMEIEYNRVTELFTLHSDGKRVLLSWEDLLEISGYVVAMKEWKAILDEKPEYRRWD